MLILLLFFSRFLVQIAPQSLKPRLLHVETCANQAEYEWVVSIQRDKKHTCNGVILDSKSILTTGMCCKEKLNCSPTGPNDHLKVLHITETQSEGFPTDADCEFMNVKNCIIHPSYEKDPYYIEYDYAIIVLTSKMKHFTKAPLTADRYLSQDYYNASRGIVTGWWLHDKQEIPKAPLECFPVSVKGWGECAGSVTMFIQSKKRTNHTHLCTYDGNSLGEVCLAFYGAPLTLGGKVVGMASHRYKFSEECGNSPFYHARIDWSLEFRQNYTKGYFHRSAAGWNEDCGAGGCGDSTSVHEVPYPTAVFLTMCNLVLYLWQSEKMS